MGKCINSKNKEDNMEDNNSPIINGVEMIDLQGQLERLVDNYRKLREKDGQGKLKTWSDLLLYEMYPGLIEDQRKDIEIRGRYVPMGSIDK
jgi:hypothetical protein